MSNYHITDDQVQVESFGQLLETGLRDEFRPAIPAVIWLFRAWLESADLRPAAQPAEQWETSPKDAEQWETSPMGGEQWQTVPFAQPVGEPVEISDHEKDCATCAHQTLPPYVPKCQQCNRLATGARRNWQAQPVPERVPMSREHLKAFMDESGYGHVTAQERADFINGFRSAEAHHRITTPSNQPARTE